MRIGITWSLITDCFTAGKAFVWSVEADCHWSVPSHCSASPTNNGRLRFRIVLSRELIIVRLTVYFAPHAPSRSPSCSYKSWSRHQKVGRSRPLLPGHYYLCVPYWCLWHLRLVHFWTPYPGRDGVAAGCSLYFSLCCVINPAPVAGMSIGKVDVW